MEDKCTDFIATELLKELKDENVRKDEQLKRKDRNSMIERSCWMLLVLFLVAGFIWYLSQYDYISYGDSTTTYTAEGTYALIDSDGNVIGYDISPDEFQRVLEVLDLGESEEGSQENIYSGESAGE